MELWIRSQDRLRLTHIDSVIINARNKKEIIGNYSYTSDGFERDIPLGEYNTEERALEVLDEISSKIKNRYIVSTTTAIISKDEMTNEYKRLNYLYSGEFIMEKPPFEIEPINKDVIYYEMPKE